MNLSGQATSVMQEARIVPLSHLQAGERGQIGAILGNVDMVHRLREIGLFAGAQVQMIRPGSPCIIRLHGQRLGFRMDDIAHVMVHIGVASRRPA
jgi:ferrous iron transport protein A